MFIYLYLIGFMALSATLGGVASTPGGVLRENTS